jgi:hypothetical protein
MRVSHVRVGKRKNKRTKENKDKKEGTHKQFHNVYSSFL